MFTKHTFKVIFPSGCLRLCVRSKNNTPPLFLLFTVYRPVFECAATWCRCFFLINKVEKKNSAQFLIFVTYTRRYSSLPAHLKDKAYGMWQKKWETFISEHS